MTIEEAAALLGVSKEDINRLREQRKIFGIKDGATWKFKAEELQRYKQEIGSFDLPVGDDDAGEREVVLTEEMLGESPPGTSSTVIGQDASKAPDPDSDVKLASDSGVSLVPAGGTDSDVKLVADSSKSGSDVALVEMGSGSGASKKSGSNVGVGSDPTLEMTDITLGSDSLKLASDDDVALAGDDEYKLAPSGSGKGSSKVSLATEGFEDDDIVLGGSSGTGSGISDSGINLEAAADSGLSLEEPLELGGDEGSSPKAKGKAESDSGELSSDDDFLLTPMLELDDQESDSSGSQVIALDTEEQPFDDQAATLLGEDVPAMNLLEESVPVAGGLGAAQPIGQPQMVAMVPAMPVGQYTGLQVLGLVVLFFFMAMTGMMMFELLRSMWSWNTPYAVNTSLIQFLGDTLGLLN
jgi:excisionase family DNA binding protein